MNKSVIMPSISSLDALKHAILDDDIEYVSFDVFDTLIMRNLWEPTDLFCFMNKEFNQMLPDSVFIDFSKIRVEAEASARKAIAKNTSYEDIILDEIYAQMVANFHVRQDIANTMKIREVELEYYFSMARKSAHALYQLAISRGKKVICVSDMYLSHEVIYKLLQKCGYTEIHKLYVSSELRISKHTGSLFRYIIRDLGVKSEKIHHIGDNLHADKLIAEAHKIKAEHFAKASEIFANRSERYGGDSFHQAFYDMSPMAKHSALSYTGIRCMLALVANKFFDNPYVLINPESDFDSNPYFIGYYAFGMYLYGLLEWLIQSTKGKYDTIHFMARDGYIVKKAYDLLTAGKGQYPKSNYLYISRKSIVPLIVRTSSDLYFLDQTINISRYTPKMTIELLKPIITEDSYTHAERIFASNNVAYDRIFFDKEGFNRFIEIFIKYIYNQSAIDEYNNMVKDYFLVVGSNDCTFDIGYSGRSEMIISRLLGVQLDAYYIHINNQQAQDSATKMGNRLFTYMPETPKVCGVVREAFLSDTSGSCIGYTLTHDGKVEPILEQKNVSSVDAIIEAIQKGALDFICDMEKIFGNFKDCMPVRQADTAIVYEYFLNNGKHSDRNILSAVTFEDDMGAGTENFLDTWYNQTNNIANGGTHQYTSSRVVYALKEWAKLRFASHPRLLRLMKRTYKTVKSFTQNKG